MSTTISCPQGFFINDSATPVVIEDLASAIADAQAALTTLTATTAATLASATAAAASDNDATNQATAAAVSAASATASAASATSSATAAAASASGATTQANSASTLATAAGNSATTASTAATSATSSATSAGNSASAAATSAASAAAAAAGLVDNDVGRNKIDNGLFNIVNRGTGPFTTNGVYTLDRWITGLTTDTMSVVQAALGDAARTAIGDEEAVHGLQNTFTSAGSAGSFNRIAQRIENVRRLAGKTITVSFWANSPTSLNLGLSFGQNFGSGGSPSAAVNIVGQGFNLSTTWTRYSWTFAAPSSIGQTFGTTANTDYSSLFVWFSAGSTNDPQAGTIGVQSGIVNLWGFQLEINSAPTPLEKRSLQVEQLACQRYFQTFTAIVQTINTSTLLATPMRVAPTVTGGGAGFTSATGPQVLNCFQTTAGAQAITLSADL